MIERDGRTMIYRGNAFIDRDNPRGPFGNPFTVVDEAGATQWSTERQRELASKTGTPETVFINRIDTIRSAGQQVRSLSVTVMTPTGTELGA